MLRTEGRRASPPLVLSALLALAGSASPIHSAPQGIAPQGYAIGAVAAVRGGLPVAGIPNGVVYTQTFDASCQARPGPAGPETRPLAATVSSTAELEVVVMGCRESAAPAVRCSWEVRPRRDPGPACGEPGVLPSRGTSRWRGWKGNVAVEIPDATGIYDVSLKCEIAGTAVPPIEVPLFVTYAPPLAAFSPPAADWYEQASCWGAGYGSRSSESEVLKAMLGGLYRHGVGSWQYGYTTKEDAYRYRFQLHRHDAGRTFINYLFKNPSQVSCNGRNYCTCSWQALVTPGAFCNFGDCYAWSEVFQAIAAVMGIGGLEPEIIEGQGELGFVVQRGSKSFDPDFPGNVVCVDDPDACYPYNFSSHSLRLRDQKYYDATFDHVYYRPDEPIALSVDEILGEIHQVRMFFNSSFRIRQVTRGYGNWNFHHPLPPAADDGPAAAATHESPEIRLTGDVTYSVVGSGPYSALQAAVGVEVLVAGAYTIDGVLFSEQGKVIADRPFGESALPTFGEVAGEPGEYVVDVLFSGDEIRQSGVDGFYEGVFYLPGGGESLKVKTQETYVHTDFAESAVVFQIPDDAAGPVTFERLDPDRGGKIHALAIRAVFQVYQAGRVALEARLATVDGTTIAYAANVDEFLQPSTYERAMRIPGAAIRKLGLDGPYRLTVILYDDRRVAVESLSETFEGAAADFE